MRRKEHRTLPVERPRRALSAAASTMTLPTVTMLSMLLAASAGCGHADEAIAPDPAPMVAAPVEKAAPAPSSTAGATAPETFEELALPPLPPPPPPPAKPAMKRHVPPRKIPVHLDGDVSSVKLVVKPAFG